MFPYLIRRILWLIPTLFCVTLLTFVIMHATPGGPWDTNPDTRSADPRIQAALNTQFGLDKPLYFNLPAAQAASAAGANPFEIAQAFFDGQFFNFLNNLRQGKLGPSYAARGRQVEDILLDAPEGKPFFENRIVTSFVLGLIAMSMALVIGLPLGLLAGLRQNTALDHFSLLAATIGYGIPSFILGILFIYLFAVWLKWIQVLNFDYWSNWTAWLLPALTLALPTAAFIARLTRSSVIEVMRQDYIRTARAKGLRERLVISRHILRNALIPIVTFLGPALAALVTGSFIIEYQFSVNGIGILYIDSINRRDYSVILSLTLLYAFVVAIANLGVDLIYGFLDPRIQAGKKG